MFNFWGSAKHCEQKLSTEMQKNGEGPLSHQKIKCSFLDYVQLLMIGRVIWANNVDQNRKKWKRPPKSSKNKMFVFGLHSTSDDRPSNLSKKMLTKTQKNEKGPLGHWKIKCLFFGLCSTSDDRPSDLSKSLTEAKKMLKNSKKWKRPPKSSKEKMFIFGLRSTSEDRPSDLSKKHWPKCKKMKRAP